MRIVEKNLFNLKQVYFLFFFNFKPVMLIKALSLAYQRCLFWVVWKIQLMETQDHC